MKRFQVRTRKYEKKNWKVVAEFDNEREANKFAIQCEMKARKSFDTMYDHWDVKDTLYNERFILA